MNSRYIYSTRKNRLAILSKSMLMILLTVMLSCQDALDLTPTDSFSDNAVWVDENLIQAFVDNTYREMPTSRPTGSYTSTGLQFGQLTDELYGRGGNHNYINEGNISPAQLGALDLWTINFPNYQRVITKSNIFFENIDDSPIEVTVKNRMIGEMKVLRAFAYFRLVALHGGIPLITRTFNLDDDFKVSRNSYDECMNFVINELDDAAAFLPLSYSGKNVGRVTKGAALAVKSRALLYMASPLNNPENSRAKWQAAADAAKAVIDLNQYSLFPDYKSLFLRENSYNSEVIWSRPYNVPFVNEQNPQNELRLYPNGYSGYGQAHPYQNLVDDYEMISGLLPKDDPSYNPQDPYVNRDPRFYATILYDGAPFQGREVETFIPGGRDSREGPISSWNATETGYYPRKFIDETVINPSNNNQGNSPWIFFRYGEILLNYAEAMYNLDNEDVCREYINKIRSRPSVNMPPVTESGQALWERLVNERRIELVFEEHRYFDVRRWKIAPTVLNKLPKRMDIVKDLATGEKTYTVNTMEQFTFVFHDRNYLVPIPQSEIEKNELLEQNPGYN